MRYFVCLTVVLAVLASCKPRGGPADQKKDRQGGGGLSLEIDVSQPAGTGNLEEAFLRHYKPVPESFTVTMPQYKLPLETKKVTNLADIQARYLSAPGDMDLLKANGFVIVDGGNIDDITAPYKTLLEQGAPFYVTADTPLHLFHIQFDETLKDIEETVFYPDILSATQALLNASITDYDNLEGQLKEAARRNVAYFSVALKQFDPTFKPPACVKEVVEFECGMIEAHQGLTEYPEAREKALFKIPEDYSQYKPRGHYTRSEILKKYFRGMMWYGRMAFLIKGHEQFGPYIPPAEALIDRETARIQTMQSALISAHCGAAGLPDGRQITQVWDRIYAVTAFYVGFADDLTFYEYRDAMRQVFGGKFKAGELDKEKELARFLLELSKLRKPSIFSGTGGAGIDLEQLGSPDLVSIKQLDKILAHTQGFRFMGQRYIPDSYILGQMVSPAMGAVPGKIPARFTVGYVPVGCPPPECSSIRAFPRGLDVFGVLGSKRAEEIVAADTDQEYPKYVEQTEKLKKEFSGLSAKDWNRNLYWSWLYSLRTLTEERGKGYQAYQQTGAWLDRQLNTALSSWAALRHDTILYAKQSYTPKFVAESAKAEPPPPPPPKGIVEPLPVFYARILATAKMARAGLEEMKVLNDASRGRLKSLIGTLETLGDLCAREAAGKPITDQDNAFLAGFPEALKEAIGDVDNKGLRTTLISDVHTDMNTNQCLQEGSGYVDLIVIAYARPEGDIVLAVGPVLSYYEFKHDISDRLTDEKWREMLGGGASPERPAWTKSFTNQIK